MTTKGQEFKDYIIDIVNNVSDSEEEVLQFLFYFTFHYVLNHTKGGDDDE